MAVTPADVKAYAPEFTGAADPLVQLFIDDASNYIGLTEFGSAYNLAVRLFVCHGLAMCDAGSDSFAADVNTQRVGDVMRSYMSTSTFAEDLTKTAHGQALLRLMRAKIGPAATVY